MLPAVGNPNIDAGDGQGPQYVPDMAGLLSNWVAGWRDPGAQPSTRSPCFVFGEHDVRIGLRFDFADANAMGKPPLVFITDVCAAIKGCLHSQFSQPITQQYLAVFVNATRSQWVFWYPGAAWSAEMAGHARDFVSTRLGLPATLTAALPYVRGTTDPFVGDDVDATTTTLPHLFHLGGPRHASGLRLKKPNKLLPSKHEQLARLIGCEPSAETPFLAKGAAKAFSRDFASFVDRRSHNAALIDRKAHINASVANRHEAIYGPGQPRCSCGAPADHRRSFYEPINMLQHCGIADSCRGLATLGEEFAKVANRCSRDDYSPLWIEVNKFFAFCDGHIYYRSYNATRNTESIVRIPKDKFLDTFRGINILVSIPQPDKDPKLVFKDLGTVWLGNSGLGTLRPQRNNVNAVFLHPLPLPRGPFAQRDCEGNALAHLVFNNKYINTWQGFNVHKQLLSDPAVFKSVGSVFCDAKGLYQPNPRLWSCSPRVFVFFARLYQLMGFNDTVYLAFINYISSLLTYPNMIHQKGFVILGPEGTWKTTYVDWILRLFGVHGYKSTKMDSLMGKFADAAMLNTVLLAFDDAAASHEQGSSIFPYLNNLLTGTTATTEFKYNDKETLPNPTKGLIVMANPKEGDYSGNFVGKEVAISDNMCRRLIWPDWLGMPDGLSEEAKREVRDDMAWLKDAADSTDPTLEDWELQIGYLLMFGFDSTAFLREVASSSPPNTITRMTVIKQKMPPFVSLLLQWIGRGSQLEAAPPAETAKCKEKEETLKTGGPINPCTWEPEVWWAVHRGLEAPSNERGWLRTMSYPHMCWAIKTSNLFGHDRNYAMSTIMGFFERNMPGCVKQVFPDPKKFVAHPWGDAYPPIAETDLYGGPYFAFADLATCTEAFNKRHHSASLGLAEEQALLDQSLVNDPTKWLEQWEKGPDTIKDKFMLWLDFNRNVNRCYHKAYAPTNVARWLKSPQACFDDESQLFLSKNALADLVNANNADAGAVVLTRRKRLSSSAIVAEDEDSSSDEPIARPHTTDPYIDPLHFRPTLVYANPILNMLPPTPIAFKTPTSDTIAQYRSAMDAIRHGGPPTSPDAYAERLKRMNDEDAAVEAALAEMRMEEEDAAAPPPLLKKLKRAINPFIEDDIPVDNNDEEPPSEDEDEDALDAECMEDLELEPLSQGDPEVRPTMGSPSDEDPPEILEEPPIPSL
jgi:hypothetical protein